MIISDEFAKKLTPDEAHFIIESNAIEGVYSQEAFDQSVKAWLYLKRQGILTTAVILKTHEIMMDRLLEPEHIGTFREQPVWIGGKEALPHTLIVFKIEDWLKRIKLIENIKYSKENLETMSKSLHIQYEHIHPFVDGNGRTGRMFMNWWRLQRGIDILIILEDERFDYYKWFKK